MRLARFLAISPSTNATVATLSIAEPARARGRFRTQGRWRERLWEIGGRAGSLGTSLRGPHGMNTKVQYYLERAEHCERMAALTSDREVRANSAELAEQWRDLVRQHQYLANPLPQSN